MSVLSNSTKISVLLALLYLSGCQVTDLATNAFGGLVKSANLGIPRTDNVVELEHAGIKASLNDSLPLKTAISQTKPKIDMDVGFSKAIAEAVKLDPKVQLAKTKVTQQQANLGMTISRLDFQFSGTVYAGIEDVTDETRGVAAVLTASKLIYDGDQIANSASSDEYALKAALESYKASLDQAAYDASAAWVELERYQSLTSLITERLAVLDPLIKQLVRIADAGVGDAAQVAAAQRTVAMIRVTQTELEERLAQAELNFIRFFGKLPQSVNFDASTISNAVPSKINDKMVLNAPGLLAFYASYLSALERLKVAKARNSVSVGFETKVQRPFGESSYDSDESIGLVVRKTFYKKERLAAEVLSAQSAVDRQKASIKDTYRDGRKSVETSLQSIFSMDKAIDMALSNAQALSNEISSLKKQLVIGQSTLDSVLSAEARLYDVESKVIHFTADKRLAQLGLLSAIGRLSTLVGIQPLVELK